MKKCLLFALAIFFMIVNVSSQLSGTYTINPALPVSATNYKTITSAVEDLTNGLRSDGGPVNGFGVTSSVIFNIANGVYNENLYLSTVYNSSTTNTITFQSASGDSTNVKIHSSNTQGNNYAVIYFNGADNFKFKNLSVETTSDFSNSYCIYINSNSQNNQISNCIIKGLPTSSTNNSYSVLYHYGGASNDNEYSNNLIIDGSTGMYIHYGYRNLIKGNTFKNQSYYGLNLTRNYDSKILSNTFTDPDNYNCYAIFLYQNYDSTHVIGNIIDGDYQIGIYSQYTYGTASQPAIFANNMIHLGESSRDKYGIYCYYSSYSHFYYNSVNLTNNSSAARCFYVYQGTVNSIRLQNNNFASYYGPAIYINTTSAIEYSNNNNYYSKNYYLGYWNGWRNNLSSWQTGSGQDGSSISGNPKFFSQSDLHTYDRILDTLGTPISTILTDIDGDIRDALRPDIGADEFSRLSIDAEIVSIDLDDVPICGGLQDVFVTILNRGSFPLTSLELLTELNDNAAVSFSWSGSLLSDSSISVNVGSFDFETSSEQSLKVNCLLPNAVNDTNTANNSHSIQFFSALSGNYTIGGTNPDFENFEDVSAALSENGICGQVIFNIRDGIYEEYFELNDIPGTDEANTILFRSESSDSSKVIIQSDYSDYTIRFNGADFVTFERISIEQSSAGNVLEFNNNSNKNQILNCRLNGYVSENTSASYAVVYGSTALNDSNVFKNNILNQGSFGFYLQGINAGNLETGTHIENNIFSDQYYTGIYLSYQNAPKILNNYFSSKTHYSHYQGISLYYCDNDLEISNNKIFNANLGLRVNYCDAIIGNESIISNNYIQTEGNLIAYGLEVANSSNLKIYYNSINELGTDINSRAFNNSSGSSNLRILNNIFSSENGIAYYVNTPTAIDSSEHNNYFSANGLLSYWNTFHLNLTSLRAENGMDINSNSVFPNFVSDKNLVANNLVLNNSGLPLTEVTKDINGTLRNVTTPDIGASEFDVSGTVDVAVLGVLSDAHAPICQDYYNIYTFLVNNSPDTLFTCNLKWELNGIAQTTIVYNDTLLTGEKSTFIFIDSILFAAGTDYKVNVWSELPNGVTDAITENDSAQTILYSALNGTYTLGGTTPDFKDFTELANHLNLGGLCGPTVVNVRNGEYNEQIAINSIVGSSSANNLTIQSETGQSENVVLAWASDYYQNNYSLGLLGTDYITIKNITISALDDEFGIAVYFENNDSLSFIGNTFSGNTETKVDSDYLNLLHSMNNTGSDKHFIGNHFVGGNHALYLDGSGAISGTIISQNKITNSFSGIYISDDYSPNIFENTINAKISGIHASNVVDNFTISKNKIIVTGTNVGFEVFGLQLYFSNADTGIISNNFISNTNTYDANSHGIYFVNSYDVQMLYNNVRNSSTYSNNSALRINGGSNYVIKNNILANTGNGYAVSCNGNYNTYVNTSDYNDYYSKGNYIFYTNGYKIPTLNMLRFITVDNDLDSNSVIIDPIFNSATDLHVNEISLNAAAIPSSSITTDIDGDLRNTTTPDIGADEFDVMNIDALANFVNTKEKFICDGSYTINSIIRNLGFSNLNSCTVNWSVNGIAQTAYSWTGTLLAGKASDTLTLGTFNFVSANNQPIVLKAWTSLPNGGTDDKKLNDTTTTILYPGLSGSFTIGKSGAEDFASFGEAKDYLMNSSGICGPVVFNVSDGTYDEYVEFGNISGTSDTNTITFNSASNDASKVTLTYNGGNYYDAVLAFGGSDYIVFNNITIEQTNSSYYCVQFENGATYNQINNCILKNSESGYAIYSDNWFNSKDNNNSFINNTIIGGNYGIYWNGWNNNEKIEFGIVIKNNKFLNQQRSAVYIDYCDSAIVRDNYIINTTKATGYNYAIYINLEYSSGYFEIVNNEIVMNQGQYGIEVEYANGNSNRPSYLANNSVSINTIQSSVYGIYIYESANVNLVHNSINIVNAFSSSYALYIDYGASINVLNNILVNQAGGYAYYIDWPAYSISRSDYNAFYSTGNIAFYHDNFGAISDLAAWNSITGFDTHSLEIMPAFDADNDLHLCDSALDNKGIYFESILTDLDGDIRDTLTPDMGADEYTALGNFDLGGPVSICKQDVILDAGPVNGAYLWSTGDITRTISVAIPGNYSVTVTTNCGNVSDAIQVLESNDTPIAEFSFEISYLTAAFTNTSTNAISYLWNFGDGNTSTEMSPTHLFNANDSYIVSLKAESVCKADSTESTVDITFTGLEESDFAELVEIYPNPTNGLFNIDFDLENIEDVYIQIFNIEGKLVYSDVYYQVGLSNKRVDISNYPTGNYTVILKINNKYVTHKLLIE